MRRIRRTQMEALARQGQLPKAEQQLAEVLSALERIRKFQRAHS